MGREKIWFPIGSTLTELVVSGFPDEYGYLGGKIHRISGDKSSGKSFFCSEIIASSSKRYGKKFKFNYDDCEYGNTIDGKSLYGFDLIDENTLRSTTVQELMKNVNAFLDELKKNEYGVYIVDSLDGLGSFESKKRVSDMVKKDADNEEGSFNAEKYKYLKQSFYPNIAGRLEENGNCILVVVSQLTTNFNATLYQKKYKVTGGMASDFYCQSHTFLKTVEETKIKVDDDREIPVAVKVKVKTEKLKAPRPYRECFVSVIFNYGFDEVGDNINFYYGLNTATGKNKGIKKISLVFEDKEYKGKDELLKYIEDNNKEDILKKMVVDKWVEAEDKAMNAVKRKPRF